VGVTTLNLQHGDPCPVEGFDSVARSARLAVTGRPVESTDLGLIAESAKGTAPPEELTIYMLGDMPRAASRDANMRRECQKMFTTSPKLRPLHRKSSTSDD
jgi:hypothetical protein